MPALLTQTEFLFITVDDDEEEVDDDDNNIEALE